MSSYDFKTPLSAKYSEAILNKAREQRQAMSDRFENNQVNWSARRVIDHIEQQQQFDANNNQAIDIRQANRDAMMQLKDTLNSIRSHRQSQFNESVPPSTQESRVRATIAVDNTGVPSSSASSSSAKPSAITINARPQNRAAFKIVRDKLCEQAKIPIKSADDQEVHVVGETRLKLKPDASQNDIDTIMSILKKFQVDPALDEDNGGTQRVETDANGNKFLIITHIFKDEDNDPFEKFLSKLARQLLGCYRSDPITTAAADSAPGFYRLGTARIELAQNIGDWVNSNETSWMKLVEGSRIAFEGILRHDIQKLVHEHMADKLVGSFDSEEARDMLLTPFMALIARDSSVNIKMPPAELLYALMVKEASLVDRRTKEVAEPNRRIHRKDDGPEFYAELFSSTNREDYTAYLASTVLFSGITSSIVRERAVADLARPLCEEFDEEDEMSPVMIGHLFPLLAKCVEEVVSVNLYAHSFHIQVDFEGIDGNVWKFLPTSAQGVLDEAKTYAAACMDGMPFDEKSNAEIMKEQEEDWDLSDIKDALRQRKCYPRGFFEDTAEKIVEEKLAFGEYLDADELYLVMSNPKRRTGAFRICVAVNSEDEEMSWARVIKAFGGQVFNPKADKKKKKSGDDDDDSDCGMDSDDDDEIGLPEADEGYMRVNYIKRPDGRHIELVRPNSTQPGEFALALLRSCDAVVVVDSIQDIEFLKDTAKDVKDGQIEPAPGSKAAPPFLFLSTKGDAYDASEAASLVAKFKSAPKHDCQSLPEGESSAAASADSFLSWLTSNSAYPNNGSASAEPASAFDFAYDSPIAVP